MTDETPQEMIERMKQECEDSIILLNQALAVHYTKDMDILCGHFLKAQEAIELLESLLQHEPDRDFSSLVDMTAWWMVCNTAGLDEVQQIILTARLS